MKKPKQVVPKRSAAELEDLARRASYVGSQEHKGQKSWLGVPQHYRRKGRGSIGFKQDATLCPMITEADRNKATDWVKNAILQGHYNPGKWDGDFPKEIWHREGNTYWFGRLTQRGGGQYKGWPISEEEWNENFS